MEAKKVKKKRIDPDTLIAIRIYTDRRRGQAPGDRIIYKSVLYKIIDRADEQRVNEFGMRYVHARVQVDPEFTLETLNPVERRKIRPCIITFIDYNNVEIEK